jgi:transposase-like protein
MTKRPGSAFRGYLFPDAVIALTVRWYLRYRLSYAEIAEWVAESGVRVDPSTIYDWVRAFTPRFIAAARVYRAPVDSRWRVDETYIQGSMRWLPA